jgi:phage gp36-like protein
MAYATKAILVTEAGGLAELEELLPDTAVDAEGVAILDPEAINDHWIAEAIRRGDDRIDAYLRPRYRTPLASPSPHVVHLAAEEALYWLWGRGKKPMPAEVVTQAEVRLAELQRLREGKMWPGDPAPAPTSGRRSTVVASTLPWRAGNLGRIL